MAWTIAFYHGLVQTATTSLLLLIVASAAVLAIRQPARRIRVIEWALTGLLFVPALALVPGYPRWSILPQFHASASPPVASVEPIESIDQVAAGPNVTIEPNAEMMHGPIDEVVIASDVPMPFEQAAIEPTFPPRATKAPSTFRVAPEPNWDFAMSRDFRFWVVIVYLSGAAAMALWSLLGLVAVRRLLWTARPASAACRDLLREIAGPRSDEASLVVSARAAQPCAIAWRPATIVLPEELCEFKDSQKLRRALAHEWSHVERGDVWSWSLSGIVRWFYFYQPLLWWLRRQLQLSQDFVADSQAARAGKLAEDYAKYLASSSARLSRPLLAAGLGIGGRNSDLKRRVVMLVENRLPLEIASPRTWNLAAFPLAILILGAVACLGEQPSGAADEPKPATASRPQTEAAKPALAEPSQPAQPVGPQAEPSKPAVAEAPSSGKPPTRELVVKQVRLPAQPRKIAVGDVLLVEVIPNIETSQAGMSKVLLRPEMKLVVDESGLISLGSRYGSVSVQNQSLTAAQKEIEQQLMNSQSHLEGINVRVAFADPGVKKPLTASPTVPAQSAIRSPTIEILGIDTSQPRRVKSGDSFNLEVEATPSEHSVKPVVTVDADGRVALGAHYGKVTIKDKTLDEAEAAIREFLLNTLKDPKVQLTSRDTLTYAPAAESNTAIPVTVEPKQATASPYVNLPPYYPQSKQGPADQPKVKSWAGPKAGFPGESPVASAAPRIKSGDILDIEIAGGLLDVPPRIVAVVEASGKVALGVHYGRVEVRGKTLEEAEEAIKKTLMETVKDPQVQVTYWRAVDNERVKLDEASKVKQLEREINELKTRINDLKAGKS